MQRYVIAFNNLKGLLNKKDSFNYSLSIFNQVIVVALQKVYFFIELFVFIPVFRLTQNAILFYIINLFSLKD